MYRAAFAAVALATIAGSASAATIVNLDGINQASLDGSNASVVALAAGTYTVTFTQDAFTAFSRFNRSEGCDAGGANCVLGYELTATYSINGVATSFGDNNGQGGLGPTATPDNGFYQTPELAFAAGSGVYSSTFTLAAPGNVRFYILDNLDSDNRGGISLSVAAVPEPATWAMLIGGFGMVGGTMRRRRAQGASLAV